MSFFSLLIHHESFSTPIKAILIPKSPTVLGFIAYFISTSSLYFSPLIRSQYAARNPVSPEPTVRANDVAFAAHAVLLSFLTWTMFWKWAWGFEQGGSGRVPRVILGIAAGCMIGVLWVMGLVWTKGRDGGRDPTSWAWIDVVCTSILDNPSNTTNYPSQPPGLRNRLRQTNHHPNKIPPPNLHQPPPPIDRRLVHRASPARPRWWHPVHRAAAD